MTVLVLTVTKRINLMLGVQGKLPDYNEPVVLPRSRCTVEDFCNKIHRAMIKNFKNANVWGASVKHRPQKVSHTHTICSMFRSALVGNHEMSPVASLRHSW